MLARTKVAAKIRNLAIGWITAILNSRWRPLGCALKMPPIHRWKLPCNTEMWCLLVNILYMRGPLKQRKYSLWRPSCNPIWRPYDCRHQQRTHSMGRTQNNRWNHLNYASMLTRSKGIGKTMIIGRCIWRPSLISKWRPSGAVVTCHQGSHLRWDLIQSYYYNYTATQ